MDLIIKERRLRWLGHLLRMEDDRIPKQAIRWQMDSCTRRRPGRPRLNWIDTVKRDLKVLGMAWEEAEQAGVDREEVWPNVSSTRAELRSGQVRPLDCSTVGCGHASFMLYRPMWEWSLNSDCRFVVFCIQWRHQTQNQLVKRMEQTFS